MMGPLVRTRKLGLICLSLVVLTLLPVPVSSSSGEVAAADDHVQLQIDWIRSKGGFVSDKIEIRKKNDDYGIFAKEDIGEDELIMRIPESCIVANEEGSEPFGGLPCGTVKTLLSEMELGDQSDYAPYTKFLNGLPDGQLPSVWSHDGKTLLIELLGQNLPPDEATSWIESEWIKGCKGSRTDRHEHETTMKVIQRAWNGRLIPIVELMGHRRGIWLNTEYKDDDDDDDNDEGKEKQDADATITASRPIEAGGELYTDYGEFTPELFRDCGIVESYPQVWNFIEQKAVFTLDYVYDEDGNVRDENDLVLKWQKEPSQKTKEEMVLEVDRLILFEKNRLQSRPEGLPEYEWNMILAYFNAIKTALDAVVKQIGPDCVESEEGTCAISQSRYNRLNRKFKDDFLDTDTCDQEKELDHSHYTSLEVIRSPYQKIEFIKDLANTDMCFSLDGIYQICTKYRPHYHEPSVHYTARFLEKIERVIFIGGGDSMLLHEVLRYPSLEFVVGLEIDQKVTRNSFKYFGTSPHWHNDKVQWWYGDAAKSLLMLPKEWFGTFDLVLIDLSETVMSNTVTKGLDIMSAMALLMKPEKGILVKNEMYFEGLSKLFKHTIQLHYYDCPLVCSQCMVLGSNGIDFVNTPLVDHGIKAIHAPVIKPDHDLELVHDHLTNHAAKRRCKADDDDKTPEKQEKSPGVAMICEAEKVTIDLESSENVKSVVTAALEKEGLTIVSASVTESKDKRFIVVVVANEGYFVARAYPEHKYCAFDIHMWGSFHKQEDVKKALLAAVGSDLQASSSFRIAAGGMFGVSTWVFDEESRGPKFTDECNRHEAHGTKEISVGDAVDVVLDESLSSLLPQEKADVAIICGSKSQNCGSISAVEKHGSVSDVVPLYTCPSINGGADYTKDNAERMFTCEKEIYSILKERTKDGTKKVGAVVVDPSAPFEMAQIAHKIISVGKHRRSFFTDDLLAVAPTFDKTETWRGHFVDHCRQFFDSEPGFKSDVLFNTSDTSLRVTTFSSGDKQFITHLKESLARVEKRTGMVSEIRHIGGVEYEMQHNFKPTQFFNATDYDVRAAYEQWNSQQAVGYQIIFQLEAPAKNSQRLSRPVVRTLLDSALAASNIEAKPEEFDELGEGSMISVSWSEGNIVVLFNGRDHVDVNIFLYEEDFEFGQQFVDNFMKTSSLKSALRDEMPRGYGRVVNFKKETEPRQEPHWAFAVTK